MEYTIIEGKKLNSTNYGCSGFRCVNARESKLSIYLKCALFRTHSCKCTGKINKYTNLLEISSVHDHEANANKDEKILISNQIKRKQKYLLVTFENYLMKPSENLLEHPV